MLCDCWIFGRTAPLLSSAVLCSTKLHAVHESDWAAHCDYSSFQMTLDTMIAHLVANPNILSSTNGATGSQAVHDLQVLARLCIRRSHGLGSTGGAVRACGGPYTARPSLRAGVAMWQSVTGRCAADTIYSSIIAQLRHVAVVQQGLHLIQFGISYTPAQVLSASRSRPVARA